MKIVRHGKPPTQPKKEKPLSENEITFALGQEKIPDKETILRKSKESKEKGKEKEKLFHSILLNKLTDDPRHQR